MKISLPNPKSILHSIKSLLYPRYCLICDNPIYETDKDFLCDDCRRPFSEAININHCQNCGNFLSNKNNALYSSHKASYRTPHESIHKPPYENSTAQLLAARDETCLLCKNKKMRFDKILILGNYMPPLEDMIKDFKYNQKLRIGFYLARLLAEKIKAYNWDNTVDLLVPVPSHWARRITRQFDQTQFLAEKLSSTTKIPYCNILKRTRYTRTQVGLSRQERINNVKGAFKVRRLYHSELKGLKICLVDDLMTTGATINEICKVLRKEGVLSVYVAILAKSKSTYIP